MLGKYSLLGCIPDHNRDPKLVEKIKNDETLKLINGGNISINYIHPEDVATAIYKIIDNKKTFKQVYNLINPTIISAKEYYLEIGRQLNKKINIKNISLSELWDEKRGWEMTTLPHIYSMKNFNDDVGFTPSIPLSQGIKDAINYPPNYQLSIEQIPVHVHMNKMPRPNKPDWLK